MEASIKDKNKEKSMDTKNRRKCKIFKNHDWSFLMTLMFICVICVQKEAFVVDSANNCYILLNNTRHRLIQLDGQGVLDFTYMGGMINGSYTYHMLALTRDGRVYAWGKNEFNQVVLGCYLTRIKY